MAKREKTQESKAKNEVRKAKGKKEKQMTTSQGKTQKTEINHN